jgi:hypothetical protein
MAHQTFINLRNHKSMELIGHYVGRPDLTVNGNGNYQQHIITAAPVPEDGTTRQLLFLIKNWAKDFKSVGGSEKYEWYDTIGGSSTTLSEQPVLEDFTDTFTSGSPTGRMHRFSATYTPVSTSTDEGFKMHRLDVLSAVPCNVLVFSAPLETQISDDQAITLLSDYSVMTPIRGYDTSASDPGNLGAVLHYQGAGDSVAHNTRRCLFQTPYPLGTYTEATSWTHFRQDSSGNEYKYRVKARENRTGDIPCEIALSATIDVPAEGEAGIRIKSELAADTWTYTTSSDLTTPTLITTEDGTGGSLNVNDTGDFVTVEGYADSGGSVKLHTVSLWETYTI